MERQIKHQINSDGSVDICLTLKLNKSQLMEGNLKIVLDLSSITNEHELDMSNNIFNISTCFTNYADSYSKKDKKVVKACAKHFMHFVNAYDVDTSNITPTDCRNFRDYLYDNLNGNTPGNYFKKFRQFLDSMVDERKLSTNPAQRIKLTFTDFRPKDIVKREEIHMIKKFHDDEHDILKAFLFSCYTGLRWCDIKELRRDNIDLGHSSLCVMQRKVVGHSKKAELHTFLNKTAINLIKDRCDEIDNSFDGRCNTLLFSLPPYSVMYNLLKRLTLKAGIQKHITFHCARHTFISNLVVKGVDIKTISELAGHSSTRHTERYMHSENEHLRESIELLD